MKFAFFPTAVAFSSLTKLVSGEGCGWAIHVEGPTNIALEAKRVIDAGHGEFIEHVDYVFAFEEHDDRRMLSGDDHSFEWAGVFALAATSHTWSMQKTSGGGRAYVDETMKLVLIPTTTPTEATMEAAEDAAETLMTGTCAVIEAGETMTPASSGSCFELHVDLAADSEFLIDTTGLSGFSVFAQHVPTEFERTKHYLYDAAGTAIEPVAQEAAEGGHAHDHGAAATGDAAIFEGAESWYASDAGKAACGSTELTSTFGAFKTPASWQRDDAYNCVRVEVAQYTADTTLGVNFTNSAFDGEALIMAFIEKSAGDGHDGHDHGRVLSGSHSFEWAGVFALAATSHTWSMQKVNGAYADATMKLVLVPTTTPTEATMEAGEDAAETLMTGTCAVIEAGETMTPASSGSCFELHVDLAADSEFLIDTTGLSGFSVYAQHVPTEFERTKHYLYDAAGTDIEPIAQEPVPSSGVVEHVDVCSFIDVVDSATGEPYAIEGIFKNDVFQAGRGTEETVKLETNWEPWIAGLIVNLVTLTGVFFMLPVLNKLVTRQDKSDKQMQMVERGEPKKDAIAPGDAPLDEDEALEMVFSPQVIAYTSAFASGSLLSCAVMLICPEALHMIQSGGFDSESAVFWRWGTLFIVGFITPTVVGALTEACTSNNKDEWRVAGGVLIGDAFHNLTDGIFMGAAFAGCSTKWGWTIAASTITHEVTQEIADFFVLTTVCKIPPLKALALNFLSGMSIFIGLLLTIEGDVSNVWTGYLLVYGGGVYVCIGGMECYSRVLKYSQKGASLSVSFLLFALGCIFIGLVLLDHEHCAAGGHEGHDHGGGGEEDAHAGHNH
ncbi:hypothetical protein TrRE_jg4709 [Triparma retinervis]|uniref:Uncharacterized protein n=1 Tax=Triparma retinervis TaxID=2557542 RepID=A0A9W7AMB4_9STRA|nr:hypothetical protein TrRE_jg4709 [Triparma retinervis]